MRTLEYAIGDVHGHTEQLTAMYSAILFDSDARCVEPKFIFLGDYVDRGPDSHGVIASLRTIQRTHDTVCLMGNHERSLLDAFESFEKHESLLTNEIRNWAVNGGNQTLDSYDIVENLADFPREDLDWMSQLPLYHATPHRLYVHAGVMPGLDLLQQTGEALLWVRERFLRVNRAEDLCSPYVVHGHTPYWAEKTQRRGGRDHERSLQPRYWSVLHGSAELWCVRSGDRGRAHRPDSSAR